MPYITSERRKAIQSEWPAHPDPENSLKTPGELNYFLTCVILSYLGSHGKSYQTINDIVGALTCASNEFYRRVVIPYEKTKEKENGDVY